VLGHLLLRPIRVLRPLLSELRRQGVRERRMRQCLWHLRRRPDVQERLVRAVHDELPLSQDTVSSTCGAVHSDVERLFRVRAGELWRAAIRSHLRRDPRGYGVSEARHSWLHVEVHQQLLLPRRLHAIRLPRQPLLRQGAAVHGTGLHAGHSVERGVHAASGVFRERLRPRVLPAVARAPACRGPRSAPLFAREHGSDRR